MARSVHWSILFLLSGALGACASSQATEPGPSPARATAQQDQKDEGPKAYAEVITDEARTDEGIFDLHWVDEKLYFEIPDSLMGSDMLLVTRIAQVPAGVGGFIPAGYKVNEQVLHWERRDDRVMLRKVSFAQVADDSLPIAISVAKNNFAPILEAFSIEAIGPDSSTVVIEVTDFYEGDTPALSGLRPQQRTDYQVRRLDADRSFINYARSYPLNVDVRHTLTFEAGRPPADAATGTISLEMHQSMILLPTEPMRPRYADRRVGWFTVNQVNFGLEEFKADSQIFLRRWRLEPSDLTAYARGELVDPVKPIVYYIDPATPERYRRWVRMGVEDWQAPFETAGFSNAILALDPPSPDEDPEWSGEDVRYSVVRWTASLTRNAQGPSVSDPRTGEIIESDIVWYHNHLRSYRNRLIIETGAANPLAQGLAVDDDLMGEVVRQVIAHEVGHALGLPHNMIASSSFPVDSLRSPSFTSRYGVAPTIMDYTRQNYIAQPGDGVTRFVRMIGPYDHYAINWGYRVIPDAPSAEDEIPTLDAWIMEHDGDRMYRYAPRSFMPNPDAQTEDMGDDPVRASGYGIANLKRVLPNLREWTATPGDDYGDLRELYGELVGMWNRYTGHVRTVVGGVYENLKATDQEGAVYEHVPGDKQREAAQFVIDEVFTNIAWLNEETILSRIEPSGTINRVQQIQVNNLNQMLDPARIQRMAEAELRLGASAYSVVEYFDDLREGIWTELPGSRAIDVYRRGLQRAYLERMETLMTEEPEVPAFIRENFAFAVANVRRSDIRPIARAQLQTIRRQASAAAGRTGNAMTQYHLLDVVARIDAMLDESRD